jgi:hypothetical protein
MTIGQEVLFNGEQVTILEVIKGSKTNKPNMQSGMVFTGYASKPCTYLLSNGFRVRGDKLTKIKTI